MSDFQTLAALLGNSDGSALNLGAGHITQVLEAIAIVKELATLGDLTTPVDQPIGLEQRLEILLTAAARAAELTGTPTDDQWVAKVRAELMVPEVIAAIAYVMRRTKAAA